MGQWARAGWVEIDRVELLEFDDVGPVGDDPVPSILLSGGRRDEMLVDLCRANGAGGETVDEFAVIGRCGD